MAPSASSDCLGSIRKVDTIDPIVARARLGTLTPTPDLRSDPPQKGEGEPRA
ncbi:hypothetical protein Amn_54030 [Aminobacter sp. Y103A]|jgi:hypothetical protein|uniref:Uncharacterized protein n=1 Tax=Aminobacter aminovorans TaxID=83263 RepID=A0AAC9FD18_AMIAI|nr:hypothetical protein AA2016_0825 [Aminobacter aminovorans]MBB3707049.1 hypothetical protein [Aminobacter aminovorans]BBD40523.1 hypothetical protein Amn_54030 [Aminobacter sp. SS-2016]